MGYESQKIYKIPILEEKKERLQKCLLSSILVNS